MNVIPVIKIVLKEKAVGPKLLLNPLFVNWR